MSIGIGDALIEAREQQGRTLQDAARDTRVRADYLRALEEEDFEVFGGDVYAKGFLSTYARYLEIDPAPLLDSYRRYVQQDDYRPTALASDPVARPSRSGSRSWTTWVVVAALVFVGAVALGNAFGGRTPAPVVDDETTPPQAAPSPTAAPSPQATETTPAPQPSPSPSPTFEGLQLLLAFEDASWIRIQVDGQTIEEGTVGAGETRTLQGNDSITVRFGNAGGVRAELNGQDLGTMGGRGEVVERTFTDEGGQQA